MIQATAQIKINTSSVVEGIGPISILSRYIGNSPDNKISAALRLRLAKSAKRMKRMIRRIVVI